MYLNLMALIHLLVATCLAATYTVVSYKDIGFSRKVELVLMIIIILHDVTT